MITVFTEINSLPGTQLRNSIFDGNTNRGAQNTAFDVRGHIVWSFKGVGVVVIVFRNQLVKMGFKIYPNARVRIFIDGQAGRSVLDKNMKNTAFLGISSSTKDVIK